MHAIGIDMIEPLNKDATRLQITCTQRPIILQGWTLNLQIWLQRVIPAKNLTWQRCAHWCVLH